MAPPTPTPETRLALIEQRTGDIQDDIKKQGLDVDFISKTTQRIEQGMVRGEMLFTQYGDDIAKLKELTAGHEAYKNKFLGVMFLITALSGVLTWMGYSLAETIQVTKENHTAIIQLQKERDKP